MATPARELIARWVDFVSRHYWLVAASVVAVTVLSLFVAKDLRLVANLSALLPDDVQSVIDSKRIKEKVGGLGSVILLIESPDSAANERYARDLLPALLAQETVGAVEYKKDTQYFEDRRLLYLPLGELKEIRRRIARKLRYEKNLLDPLYFIEEEDPGLDFTDIEDRQARVYGSVGSDTKVDDGLRILVYAYAVGGLEDIGFARRIMAASHSVVDGLNPSSYHPDMDVVIGGLYQNRLVQYRVIREDITSSAIVAILGVMLLITIYFRQAFAFVFVGLPLIIGLAWTFGITTLVIGNLNLVTGFLVSVLAGLGIDFGIHSFARYGEMRNTGLDPRAAMTAALQHTGAALTITALTTAVSFYSLMLTDFKGFSEFGFIAATGILLALVVVFVAFPAFIFIGEKVGVVRYKTAAKRESATTSKRFPLSGTVLVVSAVIIAGSVALLPQISFLYDFGNLRADPPEHMALKDRINGVRNDPGNPVVIVVEDPDERREIVRIVRERALLQGSRIRSVKSLETVLPDSQEAKMKILASIRRRLRGRMDQMLTNTDFTAREMEKLLNPDYVRFEELPNWSLRRFRGVDGSMGEFVSIHPNFGLTHGDRAIEFAEEVRSITTDKATYNASGSAVIFADMLSLMIADSEKAVGLTLSVILLILLIHFRSIKATAIVLLPVVGGVVWMCGVMVILDLKLNFYNMVVLPAILGIGVDNGVHLYHRYLEDGRGSIMRVLSSTGGPVLMTTLTTMVGFGGMLIAVHQGLTSIGKLALIGLSTCLIMSLATLPALLQYMEQDNQKKR